MTQQKTKPDVVYLIHQITKVHGFDPIDKSRNHHDINHYWRWGYKDLKKARDAIDEDAGEKYKTDPCDALNNRDNDNPVLSYERDQWRINHWIEVWGCNMRKTVNHWVHLGDRFCKAETSYEIIPLPIH